MARIVYVHTIAQQLRGEQTLLPAWWPAIADGVHRAGGSPAPVTDVTRSVQAALRALSRSKFFARVALRALIFDLKQVSGYLLDPAIRQAARDRVAATVTSETLDPAPRDGRGVWPGWDTVVWTNIVDHGDVVRLEKDLRPRFGDRVRNAVVHNGAHAHDLTDQAIRGGLDVR